MNGRREANAGTTLMELLVSLAILGMLAVIMTSMLSTGTQVWKRGASIDQVIDKALVRDRIRATLQDMPLPQGDIPAGFLLEGSAQTLSWVIPAIDAGQDSADTLRFTIELDASTKDRSVSLTETNLSQRSVVNVVRVLSTGTAQLQISYFDEEATTGEWLTTWQNRDHLPALIKIELETETGFEPPLTIQPARTARHSRISLSSPVPPG